jgi:cytosine/adenosine deaminase-related metal-dependent hydrolase
LELLTASWVVPVAAPPLRNGAVAVQDGRIVWVGPAGDPTAPAAATRRDLGSGVLLPGLVNAHCHLELSWLAGRLPWDGGFVPWVEALVTARAAESAPVARAAAEEAIRSLTATGTVAVGDVSNTLGHLDLLDASVLDAVVFHELIGWDPTRAEAILAGAEAKVAESVRGLRNGRVRVPLAAHAPHSVSAPLLRRMVAAGGPAALHLAESPDESRFLAAGDGPWREFLGRRGLGAVAFEPAGVSPTRYVDRLGVLHPRLVAAHCAQVDGADCASLARRGVHVAVCPRSNRNLGVGLPPVPDLLAAGVRLCLGTDSLASVGSLDLMEDVTALARAFRSLPAEAIVRMATAGGAEALDLPDLGTIAPGQRAALAFAPAAEVPSEPCGFLVSGEARLRRLEP